MSLEVCRHTFRAMAEELNDLKSLSPTEMLHFLISKSDNLVALAPNERTEENYVHGCVSNAYVDVSEHDGHTVIRGHSDAYMVKGLIAVLAECCEQLSVEELVTHGHALIQEFIHTLDLNFMLTPTRANAFGNVVALIIKKGEQLLYGTTTQ